MKLKFKCDDWWPGVFALGIVLVTGCETPTTPAPRAAPGPPPSSDVTRLSAWRDAEATAAAADGRSPVVGRGQSMAPIYGDNTMLVVTKIAFHELGPGMQVAYLNDRNVRVVHRLVRQISPEAWSVQGFNNEHLDTSRVTPWNLIGVVYASFVHELPDEPAAGESTQPGH